jgi:hypothetical protein
MQSALRIETQVLPGNKIEITLPSDAFSKSVGQTVEVIVIIPNPPKLMRQNVLEWIEQARSKHPSRKAQEINRDIQAERDSWDS